MPYTSFIVKNSPHVLSFHSSPYPGACVFPLPQHAHVLVIPETLAVY